MNRKNDAAGTCLNTDLLLTRRNDFRFPDDKAWKIRELPAQCPALILLLLRRKLGLNGLALENTFDVAFRHRMEISLHGCFGRA